MLPRSRVLVSAPLTSQCENREATVTVPRVLAMSAPCMPIMARVDAVNVMIMLSATEPDSMLVISAPLACIASMTVPWYSVGVSTTHSSYGSSVLPVSGFFRNNTSGGLTMSSKPSRRMFSSKMPSWSVPRPLTRNVFSDAVGSTRTARLVRTSFSNRALICGPVRNFDLVHLPTNGDLLMPNSTATVGSSTTMGGRGSGAAGSTTVSPITTSSMPLKPQMSPPRISSTSRLPLLSNSQSLLIAPVRNSPSSPCWKPIFWPTLMLPERTRPMLMRPTNLS
mmetsp:Transcript_47769/g.145298  ORF Transcript_47769/g.145298 Transcript_47769/m.145298 type:complete len:280 (-) Transcript_47769:818-1657(-)